MASTPWRPSSTLRTCRSTPLTYVTLPATLCFIVPDLYQFSDPQTGFAGGALLASGAEFYAAFLQTTDGKTWTLQQSDELKNFFCYDISVVSTCLLCLFACQPGQCADLCRRELRLLRWSLRCWPQQLRQLDSQQLEQPILCRRGGVRVQLNANTNKPLLGRLAKRRALSY